jgi:CubicO group peptidase (beta-lactamase class C family)
MSKITLPRSAPEAQGVSSKGVLSFIESVNRDIQYLHSFMLLRHGHVLAEGWWSPYRRELRHMLFSLSKSFTSTAIGFAVQEGLLSLDDTVISFFPEDAPAQPSDNLKAMKLRHILAMGGGQEVDTTESMVTQADGNWVRGYLAAAVPRKPGTHFVYNSGSTYMASAILQKITGQTLTDFLKPRLFEPLGIEGAWWESDPRGINVGGWGLNIKTDDIAKFGQLYLQKGVWQGRRLLSEAWVNEATSTQIDNSANENIDWKQGYGFQFWRCQHNAYRGDGAFGQYCIVMPDQDAVIAITSGVDDMQAVLNNVWEHLLPAMQPAPLPENEALQIKLEQALQALSIPVHAGARTSSSDGALNGKTYRIAPNPQKIESIQFTFDGHCAELNYVDGKGEHKMPIGMGYYEQGELGLMAGEHERYRKPMRYAGSGGWENDNTFSANLVCIETPFIPKLECRFDGDEVSVNLAFDRFLGPPPSVQLKGKLAG